MKMNREELIKSLRTCSTRGELCCGCTLFMNCDIDCCSDKLMQAAADMLEQDAESTQEQTADEMFLELGYHRLNKERDPGDYVYASLSYIIVVGEETRKWVRGSRELGLCPIDKLELTAVCKLLDEMEVE